MPAAATQTHIFTLHGMDAYFKALEDGARCEIDEALFVYFIDACPPAGMNCSVKFPTGRQRHADFVMPGPDLATPLRAFWVEFEDNNPSQPRYFSQNAGDLVR